MKILLVTSSFSGGGITSYAHEVVHAYSNQNNFSVVIENDNLNPLPNDSSHIYHCSTSVSKNNAIQLLHLINSIIQPDVIINSNSELMTLVTPFVANTISVVSVSHSLRYNEADIAGFAHRYTDSIIALSNYNKKYLSHRFQIRDSSKIKVIYNFVNEGRNVHSIIESKKNANVLRIVYAGGTAAAKSPELIYRILKRLLKTNLNFEFFFMGISSPPLKKIQPYHSIQELFGSDPRLIITGKLPREQSENIIKSANIFLIPSRREGCPMAMLEAMRYGAIILTSDYKNACREMITDGENGFIINHKNISSFVERITDIVVNHSKYFNFYDASYSNFKKNFSYEAWITSMYPVIFFRDYNHKSRFKQFSSFKFNYNRCIMELLKFYNKFHVLFFETLKSAASFFFAYFFHQ